MNYIPVFTLDDAYIVQYSVHQIIDSSHENIFLGSNENSGLTSLIHVSIVTLFSYFINVNWAHFFVASICFFLFLQVIFLYAQKVKLDNLSTILIIIIAAFSGFILEQFFNGLETGLLIFTITTVLFLFRKPSPENILSLPILTILPFIRPELVFLSAILFVRFIYFSLRNKQYDILFKGLITLIISAFLVISYSIFMTKGVLPNTANAKKFFFAEACKSFDERKFFLISGVLKYLSSLGIASLGFLFIIFTRYRNVFLAFILCFYTLYFYELPGGIHHNFYRYQYVFYAFAIVGFIEFCALKHIPKINRYLFICTIFVIFSINKNFEQFYNSLKFTQNENITVGAWVKNNLTKSDTILIHDAGYISMVSPSKLVDLVGLKTSASIEINKNTRFLNCGNDPRAIDAIATNYKVTHFIVLDGWDRIFQLTNSLKYMGWNVTRVDDLRGNSAYKVYKISK
nr:hypothetical protein [Acinetobacter lwoffii]